MNNVLDLWLANEGYDSKNFVISGAFNKKEINEFVINACKNTNTESSRLVIFPEHDCYSMNDILSFLKKNHYELIYEGCLIITNNPEIIQGITLISEKLKIDVSYYQYISEGELNNVSSEINKIFIYLTELLHKEVWGEVFMDELLSSTITC